MNLRSLDMKWGEKDPVLSPALCSCNTTAQWTLCGGKWVHQVGIRSSGKSSMAQCCPFSYPFMAFHFLPGDDVIRRAHRITGTCPVAFPPWELSTAFCGSSSRGLRQSDKGRSLVIHLNGPKTGKRMPKHCLLIKNSCNFILPIYELTEETSTSLQSVTLWVS